MAAAAARAGSRWVGAHGAPAPQYHAHCRERRGHLRRTVTSPHGHPPGPAPVWAPAPPRCHLPVSSCAAEPDQCRFPVSRCAPVPVWCHLPVPRCALYRYGVTSLSPDMYWIGTVSPPSVQVLLCTGSVPPLPVQMWHRTTSVSPPRSQMCH